MPITMQDTGSTHEVYGFAKNGATSARKYLLTEYSPVGEIPQGYYVILLPRLEARLGKQLQYNNKWYIVRRFERILFRDQVLYDWCLCEERGRPDTWGR